MNSETSEDERSPERAAAAIAEALEFLRREAEAAGLHEAAALIRRARDQAIAGATGASADETEPGT